MTCAEALQCEYREQYSQYRWIGTMQSVILSFYGVLVSFSLFFASKFVQASPRPADLAWPSRVLFFLGILGIIVALGLIKSRAMQLRTASYLVRIFTELLKQSKIPSDLERTVLQHRSLCSSEGRFAFLDTGNIATYLCFVFGLMFTFVGGYLALTVEIASETNRICLWFWGLLVFVFILALSKWSLEQILRRETAAIQKKLQEMASSSVKV